MLLIKGVGGNARYGFKIPVYITNKTGNALDNIVVEVELYDIDFGEKGRVNFPKQRSNIDSAEVLKHFLKLNNHDLYFQDIDNPLKKYYFYTDVIDVENHYAKFLVKIERLEPYETKRLYLHYDTSEYKYFEQYHTELKMRFRDDFNLLNTDEWRYINRSDRVEVISGQLHMWSNNEGWQGVRSNKTFKVKAGTVIEGHIKIVGDRGGQGTLYFGLYDKNAGNPPNGSTALGAGTKHVGFGEGWCGDWWICAEVANGSNRSGASVLSNKNNPIETDFRIQIFEDRVEFEAFGQTKTITSNIPYSAEMELFIGVCDINSGYGALEIYLDWIQVEYLEVSKDVKVLVGDPISLYEEKEGSISLGTCLSEKLGTIHFGTSLSDGLGVQEIGISLSDDVGYATDINLT